MSLPGRVLLRVKQLPVSTASQWRLRRFLRESRWHRVFEIGSDTRCNVPIRSDGHGSLVVGSQNVFGWRWAPRVGDGEILLQPRSRDSEIVIGNRNTFSNNVSIVAMGRIAVGDDCLFGDQVALYDCDFHEIDPQHRNRSAGPVLPVTIGNNVWLGSRAMILKGVTIGDNSVVAAMSVVNQSIPDNCVAAGNPARVIRTIE